jgi:hypothetical protein
VGLSDPLVDADASGANAQIDAGPDDGLPVSLEASIRSYGLRYFKIKLSGNLETDRSRLVRITEILERATGADYRVTLDGNEQFTEMAAFRDFYRSLAGEPRLEPLFGRTLFVEQPVVRKEALTEAARAVIADWSDAPPIIIDESDGALDSVARALSMGYAGGSHKNCKGVFKGLANGCLLARQAADSRTPVIQSGEDLVNIGPIALLQDLTVTGALGIPHLERNGHHYFRGLSMYSHAFQRDVADAYPGLYAESTGGFVTLGIRKGRLDASSLRESGFGIRVGAPLSEMTPLDRWSAESFAVDG